MSLAELLTKYDPDKAKRGKLLQYDEQTLQEMQQVDDEYIRLVGHRWSLLKDDIFTSVEDKPEFNTVVGAYFKNYLEDRLTRFADYEAYRNLWLTLFSDLFRKTEFYNKLPPKGREVYFGGKSSRILPDSSYSRILSDPKLVASAAMYAIEAAFGRTDVGVYPVNALLLLDMMKNDKDEARKVLQDLGLSRSDIEALLSAANDERFISSSVLEILNDFTGKGLQGDPRLGKVLSKLRPSNIKLLSGTIDNEKLVDDRLGRKMKTVKFGQAASTTAGAAPNSAGPSTTSAVSYSSFWPVVLSLAGLSLLGWYAYKNWFGSSEEDEEAEKEHIVDLSGKSETGQEGKQRVVIKL